MSKLREAAQMVLDALETGLDCARDKAENIHESYKGYFPERHAQADKDVANIEEGINAIRAALAEPDYVPLTDADIYKIWPYHIEANLVQTLARAIEKAVRGKQ
jgi:hypothetical protein